MVKVYFKLDNSVQGSYLIFLYPNLGFVEKRSLLYMSNVNRLIRQNFIIVEKPEDADYFLLPYNFYLIRDKKDYLDFFVKLSKKYNKKIIIFDLTDFDYDIAIPNSIVFRTSQYRYKKNSNEQIMPPPVEDLGKVSGNIEWRNKTEKPKVGFVGWANFTSKKQQAKDVFKNFVWEIKSLFNGNLKAHKSGIYFRKKCIKVLKRSSLVDANFILRKSYSGHESTIEVDPNQARKEYIENIINSDFVLCPKGDGNFSARFYEVLSLGRIPVLLDTETVLPLEDVIDYQKFILKINYQDINKIDLIIYNFFVKINNEEFKSMQKAAREAYEKFLDINSYFDLVINDKKY